MERLKEIALTIYGIVLIGAFGSFLFYGFMVTDITDLVFNCEATRNCYVTE